MNAMVIAVNFHSAHLTESFLRGLDVQERAKPRCLIVDNSDNVEQVRELRKAARKYEWAEVVVAPGNLGYFGGFRFGLDNVKGNYDWIVMSNMDITYDPHAFDALDRVAGEDIGLVGPDIVEEGTGRNLNPFMATRPSLRSLNRLRLLFRFPAIARLYIFAASVIPRSPQGARLGRESSVFGLHGSAIAMSDTFLSAAGPLEYPAFLFGEEIFLGELCRRKGLRAVFLPSMRARHLAHATTGVWRSKETLEWQRNALGVCVDLLKAP